MGKPNEYDLNIVLYNEALMHYSKLVESHPGFLQLQIGMKGFRQDEAQMTGTAQAQFEGLLSGSGGLKNLVPTSEGGQSVAVQRRQKSVWIGAQKN